MKKLLIVDDNTQNLYMLEVLLKTNGFEVETAANGAQALELARQNLPEMIISDILMPVMDGFNLCRNWMADERLKEIPFIFYTATYIDSKDEAFALNLGADRFLVKPMAPDEFLAVIQEVFKTHPVREPVVSPEPEQKTETYYKEYSEVLIRKLEDKMMQLEQTNKRLNALYQASCNLVAIKSSTELTHWILQDIVETAGYQHANFFQFDENENKLSLMDAVGFSDGSLTVHKDKLVFSLGEERGLVGLVAQDRQIINLDDTTRDPRWIALDPAIHSALFVPVQYEKRLSGVIALFSIEKGAFSLEDEHNIAVLANSLAVSIENIKIEEALKREQFLMQSLMDTVPDSIYFKDTQSRFIRVNKAQVKKLGRSNPEQILGKTDFDFFAADHAQSAYNDEQAIIRTGQPLINLEELETFSGRPSEWVSTTKMPLRGPQGKTIGTFGISRDISELKLTQKSLIESEERYRKLVEESHELIFTHDLELNILSMNPAMLSLFGLSPDLVPGLNLYKITPINQHKDFTTYIQSIARDGIDSGQWFFLAGNDQEYILNYKSTLLYQQNHAPVVRCMVQDVTIKIHHDQELEAIAAISSALRSFTTKQEIFPAILQVMNSLVGLDSSAISLLNEENGNSIVELSTGEWGAWSETTISLEKGIYGQVYESNSSFIDEKADQRAASDWPGPLGNIQTVVCIPLITNNLFIGAIWLGSKKKFSKGDLRILRTLSDFSANAIRNAVLYKQIQDRASSLASLYDVGLAISSVLEPQAQLEFLSKIIMDEFHADRTAYLQFIPEESCFSAELCLGFQKELQARIYQTRYTADESLFPVDWVRVNELPLNKSVPVGEPGLSLGDPDVRSVLWAPVKHGNNFRGLLGVMSLKPNAFTPNQQRLFLQFANQAAVARENASLLFETSLQVRRLNSLRKIDKAINSSLDLKITTNILLEQFINQLNVDAADIQLFNPFTRRFKYIDSRGFYTSAGQNSDFPMGHGLAEQAVNERQILHVSDLSSRTEILQSSPFLKQEHFVEYFGVPLISKGIVKGIMELFHRAPLKIDDSWLDFMETLAGQAAIGIENILLFENLQSSNNELAMAYDATIEGWSNAMDLRDKETEGHTRRVTEITIRLAKAIGFQGEELVHIRRGTLLHDIGKMGIPDNILLKPGPLTDDEWGVMRRHPMYAFDLLSPIAFLKPALDIPYCHHEKWDGSGYPRKLSGEQIPLAARLFAIVDVWDALTSDRPYRKAWPESQAIAYIREQAGRHFDPKVVEVFFDNFIADQTRPNSDVPESQGVLGLDRYAYVNNNPVNFNDPTGHDAWWCGSDQGCQAIHYSKMGYSTQRPPVFQVDLAKTPIKQDDITVVDSSGNSMRGYNACAIAAGTSAGADWDIMVANANANGYLNDRGMQPSHAAQAYRDTFGLSNVYATPSWTIDGIYDALYAGKNVIVDMLVAKDNDGNYSPSSGAGSVAHFARVVGIDWVKQTLTIENTLNGENYWVVSFNDFKNDVWYNPEKRANIQPKGGTEVVNHWGVTIINSR